MIKALIFDIGGVIASDVWESLFFDKKDGLTANFDVSEGELKKAGRELWNEFAFLSYSREENKEKGWRALEKKYWDMFLQQFNLPLTVEELIDRSKQFVREIPGMYDLLRKLHDTGITLAICSNNTEFWFERQMEQIGLSEFFEPRNIIISCRVGSAKSNPNFEMFKAVCRATGFEGKNCIFIEDRPKNIEMALKFGMPGILFPSKSPLGAAYLESIFKFMGIL